MTIIEMLPMLFIAVIIVSAFNMNKLLDSKISKYVLLVIEILDVLISYILLAHMNTLRGALIVSIILGILVIYQIAYQGIKIYRNNQ